MQIELKDNQSLKSAATCGGYSIPIYDDGFGPLWAVSNCFGVIGVIRAQTWEDAWSIAEDEIFPRASEEDIASFEEEYGPDWMDDGCWNESYGFSGNNGIYEKDLNGDYLNPLTAKDCEECGISLDIETEVEPVPEERHFAWHKSRMPLAKGRHLFSMTGRYGVYSKIVPNGILRRKCQTHSHFSPQNESLTLILNP